MQVKKFYILISIIVLSNTCPSILWGQTWQSLNGPIESDVQDIVIKNDSIYVASGDPGGFFKKRINSFQWYYSEISEGEGPFRKAISGLLSISVDDEGNYYAGGAGDGTIGDGQTYNHFFMSENYGKSWVEFREGIETSHTIQDIFITNEEVLLLGSVGGIRKFNKEENKFQPVGNTYWAYTFSQVEDTIVAGTIEGIEYSMDNGHTWTSSGPDTLRVFSITYANENYFFGTNLGLYQTGHLDQPWTHIEDLSQNPINALYSMQDMVIAGTHSGSYVISTDNLEVDPIFGMIGEQKINVINSFEETIYLGTENGFYSCNIDENTCNLNGVPGSWVRTMNFQNEVALWAGTAQNIHRYFTETKQWDSHSVPIGRARNIVPSEQDSIYVVDDTHFHRCSFNPFSCESHQIDPGTPLFDLKQNTAGDLFLASRKRVFQSSDKGENWKIIYTSPENNIFSLETFSDSLLFINGGGSIKYSLDTETYEILINSIDLITDDGILFSSVNGIQKSADFGESWTTIFPSGVGGIKFLLFDEDENKHYAISTLGRVYVTDNYENGWGINEDMFPINMESAAIGPDGTLYLGTMTGGIFTNTEPLNPPITISIEGEPGTGIPNNVILRQNYPNPFNPTTVIGYQLPVSSEVSLVVYDLLGRRIATLVNEMQSAGAHTVHFDGSALSSGTYIYRLQTGGFFEVHKMTLIK